MIYVLDTDHLTLLGHKDSPEAPLIRRRIAELPAEDAVVTTIINFEEQVRGWTAALARTKSFAAEAQIYSRLMAHVATFRRMTILDFDQASAAMAQQLRKGRLAIGTMDLKIASVALVHGAVVVSRNLADFRKVPDLHAEDWSLP